MYTENRITRKEVNDIEDWRNEHGLPDFNYLQSLVTDGSFSM